MVGKPSTKKLKEIYKGILSTSIVQRIQSLSKALQWYESAVPYIVSKAKGKKLTDEQLKNLSLGNRYYDNGLNAETDGEKETLFKQSVTRFERICEYLHPPILAKYYEMYLGTKSHLEAEEIRLQDKFASVLMILTEALPSGLCLKIHPKLVKPRQAGGVEIPTLLYSRAQLDVMKVRLRKEGALAVVMSELPHIARSMSFKSDGCGGFAYDPERNVKAMEQLTEAVALWARSEKAPNKLVKHGTTKLKVVREQKVGTKPVHSSSSKGEKGTLEYYRPNSCIGIMAKKLSNGKMWEQEKLFKECPGVDKLPSLKRLVKHGSKYGNWEIVQDGTKLTMKMTGGE